MGIRKEIKEKIKKGYKSYIDKGQASNRVRRITETAKKSTDEAERQVRKMKNRDKLVGAAATASAIGGYKLYDTFSPYKVSVGISKKDKSGDTAKPSSTASSSTNTKKVAANKVKVEANKVTQARKEQMAATAQKNMAAAAVQRATTNKAKLAANKAKVAANSKEIAAAKAKAAANKKKVAANTARYKN